MISIRAYGDSLARGIGDVGTGNQVSGWPGRLAHSVQARAQRNLAVAGARAVDVLNCQVSLDSDTDFDVALLSVGGNDAIDREFCLDGFAGHFEAVVAALLRHHRIVIALSVADHSQAWPLPRVIRERLHRRIAQVNTTIRTQKRRRVIVMEPWQQGQLNEMAFRHADRVHLSPRGYQRLAELTAECLAIPLVAEPLPVARPGTSAWYPEIPGMNDVRRAIHRIPALIHCASRTVSEPAEA